MTQQERFRQTLAHQQPDRPPIRIWYTPEIEQQLQDHFENRCGRRDLQQVLELISGASCQNVSSSLHRLRWCRLPRP